MSEGKLKFGILVEEVWEGYWSFGICLSHSFDGQTYIILNLFKWSISIGKVMVYEEEGGIE